MQKFALYVEGQTEHVLLDHLIRVWWEYNINIQNIKMRPEGRTHCQIKSFSYSNADPNFLIIDVEGVGSLPSVIANYAEKQQNLGFKVVGVRDLYAEDYDILRKKGEIEPEIKIRESFYSALKHRGYQLPNQIELFFAIMEVDAWYLAFTSALSEWSNLTSQNIEKEFNKYKKSSEAFLETIPRPSVLREKFGNNKKKENIKSFHSLKSFVSHIKREHIEEVYNSQRIPSFNKLWGLLTST